MTARDRLARVCCALAGTTAGLAVCVAVLLSVEPRGGLSADEVAWSDESVREEVFARLINQSTGLYDLSPDPDVRRVLLPKLPGRVHKDVPIESNRLGMREQPYELPKTSRKLRIVLLGDLMVFGSGVPAEDRMGRALAAALREQSPAKRTQFEVLHLGIPSWNIQSETEYLRRQLSLLRPDLVIHMVIINDIEDCGLPRGNGQASAIHPEFGNGFLTLGHAQSLGAPRSSPLALGLDYESTPAMPCTSSGSRLPSALARFPTCS